MTPSYGRTKEQHDNTQLLIDGFKALPDDYNLLVMKYFAINNAWAKNATPEHPCKTTMCIIGHGPSFGIPHTNEDRNSWEQYSFRAFGFEFGSKGWSFCFSSNWPNDMNQAIIRLEMMQRGEVPDVWDYDDVYTNTP